MYRASVNDCQKPSIGASKADLRELHREKMRNKAARRARAYAAIKPFGLNPYAHAGYNPKTGKPHEHAREIARNLRRSAA